MFIHDTITAFPLGKKKEKQLVTYQYVLIAGKTQYASQWD
jgi:hypothetical protein